MPETDPLIASKLQERYKRTPPPPRRPTWGVHLSVTILIFGFFVFYAQRSPSRSQKTFNSYKTPLPSAYAICTKGYQGVYTVPEDGGVGAAECVVVKGDLVADTGSLKDRVRRRWGDKKTIGGVDGSPEEIRKGGGLEILYLPEGHTLTPGMIDSHGHSLEYGYYSQLPLQASSSPSEIVKRVESFIANHPDFPEDRWIEGMGWDQNLFPTKQFPTYHDLEKSDLLRGKKICLARVDVHAEWVSKAVLDLLEERGLPHEVEGGLIVRDGEGEPTGVFLDNAIELINEIRPQWTGEQCQTFLDKMSEDALSKGLTTVHDARAVAPIVDFFKQVDAKNKLPLRFNLMLSCGSSDSYCGDEIDQIPSTPSGKLSMHSVKLFADGALGSRGAALLDDYSDQTGWRGLMLVEEDKWEGIIRKWHEKGWQVNVHCIGDRANHIVLNAIESIIGPNPGLEMEGRFRIEHAQIMTPNDLKRAVRQRVIASYQPTHATSDMWYAQDRLGEERLKGAYAWQSYLKEGGRIALGSDFPVESIDPLKGFYAAVTRLSEAGKSPNGKGGWRPEEKLTREQALRGFTTDGAFAGLSNMTGSLTIGKKFDAVIWDDDLMSVPIDEMLEVKVKSTIIDGKIVWGELVVSI